jgi:hypothetical protein
MRYICYSLPSIQAFTSIVIEKLDHMTLYGVHIATSGNHMTLYGVHIAASGSHMALYGVHIATNWSWDVVIIGTDSIW